ncbi:c-type cytochrome biogenesis protein CcsB [Duganella callida]|uniref:C-type cytochrome biogenesis protein CcsB n=1 Tax=Duganella callida TaxID=2561932 RepID=A0A4Y9SI09_9BURK|nr:c-type cytochrome biogenesis protein CcsB [Duganella callida]TFW21432.1 c-type cytochrome biogenesis protein CcsB [Duganella callida]
MLAYSTRLITARTPRPGLIRGGIFLALLGGATCYALLRYQSAMDMFDTAILIASAIGLGAMALAWTALQPLTLGAGAMALAAIALYHRQLEAADHVFLLKYFLSSQTAIMWMGLGYWAATVLYALGWLRRASGWLRLGTRAAWTGSLFGLAGLLVRWHESYLMGPDIGHIPVSNLYEVFVLFAFLTTMLYLHLEAHFGSRQLGLFAMTLVSAAVVFMFKYGMGAHEIQPLIPALKSYWMKVHVPANFIGYGAFSMAAMFGAAWLLADKPFFASRLPSRAWLDELSYKAIALGFVFFTIATILGALWAAEAWGGYWSWDPKETWALIVWLNYAAWLHTRLVKNVRGALLAWWSLVGFGITLFAFLGVNMFLSGLHSYGSL